MPTQAAVCLFRLLCACSGCCVPAQTAVCLLRLLCACSAGCVPAQPAVCHNTTESQPVVYHNTAEPTVCLQSLLYCDSILENGQ